MAYICSKCGAEVKGRIDSPVLEALELCENCRMAGAIEEASRIKTEYTSPPPMTWMGDLMRALPESTVRHNSRRFLGAAGLLLIGTIAAFYLGSQPAGEYPTWVASLMHVLPFAFFGLDLLTFGVWIYYRYGDREDVTHK